VGVLSALAATVVEMAKGDIAHMDFFWWLYALGMAVVHMQRHPAQPAKRVEDASDPRDQKGSTESAPRRFPRRPGGRQDLERKHA
jgi:hypothetical protein